MGSELNLIEDNSLRDREDGFEFQVHLLWYRSLPLSCVEKVNVKLNGEEIDPGTIRFGVNDHLYQLDTLEEKTDETWFVQDPAHLVIKKPQALTKGQPYTIEAEVVVRIPYIKVGPKKFLKVPRQQKVKQIAS